MTDTDPKIDTEDFLARAPLFARLGRRSLHKLAALCISRDFEPGAVVISEGDTGLGLFVIVSGSVEITKRIWGRNPPARDDEARRSARRDGPDR